MTDCKHEFDLISLRCKKCNTPVKTAMADLGVPTMTVTAKYDPEVLNQIIKQVESDPITVSRDGVMIGHVTEARLEAGRIVGKFNPVYPEVPDCAFCSACGTRSDVQIHNGTNLCGLCVSLRKKNMVQGNNVTNCDGCGRKIICGDSVQHPMYCEICVPKKWDEPLISAAYSETGPGWLAEAKPDKPFEEVRRARVVDADTIEVYLPLPKICRVELFLKCCCRLSGIDAPEKTTKAGLLVKQIVECLFPASETCTITYCRDDKYSGRFEGLITVDTEPTVGDLSEYLLRQKLVKPYSGGVRTWSGDELDQIQHRAEEWLKAFNKRTI